MDEDPEALVHRRLLRDPEDARELVLQRARPVRLDVRGAAAAGPSPRRGRNVSSDGSVRAATARARSRSSRSASSRYSSSALVSKISRCSAVAACSSRALTSGSASATDCSPARVRSSSARELEQLEVADDRVRDVEVGVEAQLAEPAADLRDRGQQLVAQQPERRLQRLGGPEQLLLARLPLAADRRARLLGERRRLLRRAALGRLRVGEHEPPPRARHRRRAAAAASRRRAAALESGGSGLLEQRVGDRLERAPPRPGHARAPSARARRRGRTRAPWPRASSSPARRPGGRRPPPPPRAGRPRRPRRSSGRTRARSPAARGAT